MLPDGATPSGLTYQWHRSHDGETGNRSPDVEAAASGADDVGCWLFCEWRYADARGGAAREGRRVDRGVGGGGASAAEDRDDLKAATLKGTFTTPVKTSEGGATLTVPATRAPRPPLWRHAEREACNRAADVTPPTCSSAGPPTVSSVPL